MAVPPTRLWLTAVVGILLATEALCQIPEPSDELPAWEVIRAGPLRRQLKGLGMLDSASSPESAMTPELRAWLDDGLDP